MGANISSKQPVPRLTEEDQWAKYFSRVIDDLELAGKPEYIEYVYEHWAGCLNSGDFSAAIPSLADYPTAPRWV
jgi:hypothetical protein